MNERARWREQWAHFAPELEVERALLADWLRPLTLDALRGRDVLDAGCGSGTHAAIYLQAGARSVTALDYASWEEAARRWGDQPGLTFGFHDLCAEPPPGTFDVVACVGVLPHVPDPQAAIHHLAAAVRPGGTLVVWATVREGNTGLLWFDRGKRVLTGWAGRRAKSTVALGIAIATRPAQRLAARSRVARSTLPYGRYLERLASLPVDRVRQNFYDALNAPRRILFREADVAGWIREAGLASEVHVSPDGKSRTFLGRRT